MISCGCFLFDSMSFMGGVRTLPSEVFPADPEGQFFRYSTAARPSLRGQRPMLSDLSSLSYTYILCPGRYSRQMYSCERQVCRSSMYRSESIDPQEYTLSSSNIYMYSLTTVSYTHLGAGDRAEQVGDDYHRDNAIVSQYHALYLSGLYMQI